MAGDLQVDLEKRYRHCIMGTMVEAGARYRGEAPRAELLSACLSELPHHLPNSEIEALRDDAIRLIVDLEEDAYIEGEDAGRRAAETRY